MDEEEKVHRCYVAPRQESHNQLLKQVKARMLMQSVEISVGARASIYERAPKWREQVREGCAMGRTSCNDGVRLGNDGLGLGEYGYTAGTDEKRIARRRVWNSLSGG